jgi:hypothetical protein
MVPERCPAESLLVEPQGMNHGAHRPVEDGNAGGQESVQ